MTSNANTLKPWLMQQREIKWGKPFDEYAKELYQKHGNLDAVAEVMEVSRPTLYVWLRIRGLTKDDLREEAKA